MKLILLAAAMASLTAGIASAQIASSRDKGGTGYLKACETPKRNADEFYFSALKRAPYLGQKDQEAHAKLRRIYEDCRYGRDNPTSWRR